MRLSISFIAGNFKGEKTMNTLQELEEKLFACWNVVDDIDFFYHREEEMNDDEKLNYLLGLMTKYKYRFSDMFDTYEELVKEYYRLKRLSGESPLGPKVF